MSYTSIRSAIETKLNTLTGSGKLAGVYDSFEEKITGYPAVMFEPVGYESEMHSTTDNLRTYEFVLVFFTTFDKTKTRSEALDILLPAVDDAIAILESDYTLGGVVDYINNTVGDVRVESSPSGAILFVEMRLRCTSEVSIST